MTFNEGMQIDTSTTASSGVAEGEESRSAGDSEGCYSS